LLYSFTIATLYVTKKVKKLSMNETTLYVLITALLSIGVTYSFIYFLVLQNYREQLLEQKAANLKIKEDLDLESKRREQINLDYVAAKTDLHNTHIKLTEQKEELEALNEKLTKDFENIANNVVHHNSKVLQERHEEKLMALLTPFKERIELFEKRVEATHRENTKDNQMLKEQLLHLGELNRNIGEEAKNLTRS